MRYIYLYPYSMSSVAENVLEQMVQSGEEDSEVIQGLLDQIESENKKSIFR